MKIAHYASSISHSAGGLYYSVSGLAKAQQQAGSEVLVIGGADEHFESDKHQWGSVKLFPHKLGHRYGLSAQVFSELSKYKPDIFHVHGMWSAASVYALAASVSATPVVIAPRGMLDRWILGQKRSAKRLHGTIIERPLLRRAYVHALNESERVAVGEYMPRALARTFVVPNGVDGRTADRVGDKQCRSGALYLGRLHPKKQVLELVNCWGQSAQLRGTSLTVAGWGDTSYETEVSELASRFENIHFVGPLYGAPKELALQSARYFILPSLSEGLPMSVLEALSCGAIPLITAQCNLPELIDDNVAFEISPKLDNFVSVLRGLMDRPAVELDRLADKCSLYAQRYQWESIARQMHSRYLEILSET